MTKIYAVSNTEITFEDDDEGTTFARFEFDEKLNAVVMDGIGIGNCPLGKTHLSLLIEKLTEFKEKIQ